VGTLVHNPLKEKYYMTFLVLSTVFFVAGGKPCKLSELLRTGELCIKSEPLRTGKPCKLSEPLRTGELCIKSEPLRTGKPCKLSEPLRTGKPL
jgi:hypothetical protein